MAFADASRRHTRPAYQAEKFLSFRRTHLLQIDGNDGSNSGLGEFFALAHARITPVGVRVYINIYIYIVYVCIYTHIFIYTRISVHILPAKYIIRGEWTVNAVI